MRDFLIVLKYTFRENIRKKSFIISTAIILVLTCALMILPSLITNSEKSQKQEQNYNEKKAQKFYILDKMNALKKDASALTSTLKGYEFSFIDVEEEQRIQDEIKQKGESYLLVLDEQNGQSSFTYFVNKYGLGPSPEQLEPLIKNQYTYHLLKDSGVNEAVTGKVLTVPKINVSELGKSYLKNVFLSILIIFVLFFAVYFFGYGVTMSVASEKTSRVMETLITSTNPTKIIFGKTVAMGLLGLLQLTLIIATAITTYKIFFPKDFMLFGSSIDFSSFTPLVFIMVFVYFVLGYFLFAMLNAAAGATVSKTEDINTAIMPVSMIGLISFYLSYIPSTIPNNTNIITITSLIPFTSPFTMPGRLLSATVSPMELVASLALLVIAIILVSFISVKIYSNAILHYGNRLKLSDFIRFAKKK